MARTGSTLSAYRVAMASVMSFDEIDASMLSLVGGKALNLGILTRAGFAVPPGFCVTTAAYRTVVADRLNDLLASGDAGSDNAGARQELARSAREVVHGLSIPDDLVTEIVAGYESLGPDAPVAVRSSATAEDLAYASFAGQQDSYLNVVGASAVLDAVRRCWASLWNERAVSYRAVNGIPPDTVTLAVVIQQMVSAQVAGVMFTADPITGTRHHTVIDASPGLGEAVVSGLVNPDHFVVDLGTNAVVERRLGDKRVIIREVAGGGTERVDADGSADQPCLDDDRLVELAQLGHRVQDHYGAPQDIEWALADRDQIWLTQSRPVTTLYPLVPRSRPGTRAFLCLTLAQGLTRPITPMGLSAFRLIGTSVAQAVGITVEEPLAGPPALTVAGQRLFVDATALLRNRIGRRVGGRIFSIMEARSATVVQRLGEDPRFALIQAPASTVLAPVALVLIRLKAPLRAATALISPAWAYRQIADLERRLQARLIVPRTATPRQRLDHVEQRLGSDVFWLMPTAIGYAGVGFALLGVARRLLGPAAEPREVQTVLRGLPHNVTTEMDLELWGLAQRVRQDPPSVSLFAERSNSELAELYRTGGLPPVTSNGLRDFLERYGHRAVAEIDLGMSRWSDDPSHLLGMVRNYLQLDDPVLAPDAQFAQGAHEAEAMIDSLVVRARRQGRLRAALVSLALRRARQLCGLRETPKFLLVMALSGIRSQLALVGTALAQQGQLERADDIFFVDLAAARRGLEGEDLRPLVVARREDYGHELRRRHIPRLLLSDGTEPEAQLVAADAPDGSLVGSPASAGVATGPARVILDPVGAHLEPGDILVAPSTDPGWTPLFLTAGGLVMEMGGSNSHGAVVAREYGIPAVVGVPDATRKIADGQRISVDGAAGLVRPA